MSVAVQQFLEMVREAYQSSNTDGADKVKSFNANEANVTDGTNKIESSFGRMMYCEVCGTIRQHRLEEKGLWEVYRCCVCGYAHYYKVK